MKKNNLKKIVLSIGMLGVVGVGLITLYYSYHHQEGSSIRDFNELRDTQFILDSFNRDWHWLVEGFSFSPEKMLRGETSGKLDYKEIIKVGYQGGKPAGFVIYHKKSFYLGKIHFIDVDPTFRSQGWSDKLLDYAVKDLIQQGMMKIELVTRIANYPAQKLYTRYGFKEVGRDDDFVYFDYMVPEYQRE